MEGVAWSVIDEDEDDMLPAEQFVAVRELVSESGAGAAFVDKAPQWTIGHKMAVFVVALATFVLGMAVGVGVHGHLPAAALRYVCSWHVRHYYCSQWHAISMELTAVRHAASLRFNPKDFPV